MRLLHFHMYKQRQQCTQQNYSAKHKQFIKVMNEYGLEYLGGHFEFQTGSQPLRQFKLEIGALVLDESL